MISLNLDFSIFLRNKRENSEVYSCERYTCYGDVMSLIPPILREPKAQFKYIKRVNNFTHNKRFFPT